MIIHSGKVFFFLKVPPKCITWVPRNPDLYGIFVENVNTQPYPNTAQSQALVEIFGSPKFKYRYAKYFFPIPGAGHICFRAQKRVIAVVVYIPSLFRPFPTLPFPRKQLSLVDVLNSE